jgi:peptidoglycan-associated lipoprotein
MSKHAYVSVMVLAVVVASGCARKPVTTVSAVPPPTGAAQVSPMTGVARSAGSAVAARPPEAAAAEPARQAPREFAAVAALEDIRFDFDKYAIRPGDGQILDRNARWLRDNPGGVVLIEGHCDERGTNEYNLALGDRRAKATMEYLVARGVAAQRMSVISYGEERPLCRDHHESCWERNRRAHFLVKSG